MPSRKDVIKQKIDEMVHKAEAYARVKGKEVAIAPKARRSMLRDLLVRSDVEHDVLLAKVLAALNKLTDRAKNGSGVPKFPFDLFEDGGPSTRH